MMTLPALSAEERACIESGLPDGAVHALAQRIGQHLHASLGIPCAVDGRIAAAPGEPFRGRQPAIGIDPGLTSAWLNLRCGGSLTGMSGKVHDPKLTGPLTRLVQRALAETVINQGERAPWPQAMRIQLQIGSSSGAIDIAWDRKSAWDWAQHTIRAVAERKGRT